MKKTPQNNEMNKRVDDYINKSNKKHNNKYEYPGLTYYDLIRQPNKKYKKIKIKCPIHGIFKQDHQSHLYNSAGCSKCTGGITLTNEEYIARANKIHKNTYGYSKVEYETHTSMIIITCKKHGDFIQQAREHLKGSGCKICSYKKNEKMLAEFFITNNIDFMMLNIKYFSQHNNKHMKFRPDFYLPKYNLFVEYNGPQHYIPVRFGGISQEKAEEKFKKQQIRDSEFRKYCNNKKAELLEIDGRKLTDKKLLSFINDFIKNKENENDIIKIKPWGEEHWLTVNKEMTMKKLIMKKNEKCSMQYHEYKQETFYVLSGKLKFTIGKTLKTLEEKILSAGDHCTILPNIIHRMEAIEDSEYLECSTSQLFDVVRLQDDYDRK